MNLMPRLSLFSIFCAFSMLVSACGGSSQAIAPAAGRPTPTISPLFSEPPTSSPVLILPTRTPQPTMPPKPTAPAEAAIDPIDVPIYQDDLIKTWVATGTTNTKIELDDREIVHSGRQAISMKPTQGTGKLQLSVRKEGGAAYRRDQVVGLRFWVSGGPTLLAPADLLVTVLGSNKQPFYVEGDTSVSPLVPVTAEAPLFSETRLYFLGFNNPIPANQWVEVFLYLDEREFDPNYTYVTGMYFKNDSERSAPIYFDDIQLMIKQ